MSNVSIREAINYDIPFIAKLRSENPGDEQYWIDRISKYLEGTHNPQKALKQRIIYVASVNDIIIGFIAGHLSQRYECEGELQWIDINEKYRRNGIASDLIKLLGNWFIAHHSYKICVDPGNEIAKAFYKKNGATSLNEHWMFWNDIRSVICSP